MRESRLHHRVLDLEEVGRTPCETLVGFTGIH